MDLRTLGFSRVLVAGGAGFIGSHIVDRLLEEEVEVVMIDNLYTGKFDNISRHKRNRKFRFIEGDVREYSTVKRAVKGVDAVFNEAAVVGVPRSIEDPVLANEVNTSGTLKLLKACCEVGVKRYVQASSASIYGNARTLPIEEGFTPNPVSPYAVAELAAENYARVFHSVYGLETVCLRYFNVYGPRQLSSVYSGVIPIFLDQILHGKRPAVFGDGEQTRDFVYVEDVVEANMLALAAKEAAGEAFNVATGHPSSINQLISSLQKNAGVKALKPLYKPSRLGDTKFSFADIKKAERILGYKPKYDLEKGIAKLTRWFKENKK